MLRVVTFSSFSSRKEQNFIPSVCLCLLLFYTVALLLLSIYYFLFFSFSLSLSSSSVYCSFPGAITFREKKVFSRTHQLYIHVAQISSLKSVTLLLFVLFLRNHVNSFAVYIKGFFSYKFCFP